MLVPTDLVVVHMMVIDREAAAPAETRRLLRPTCRLSSRDACRRDWRCRYDCGFHSGQQHQRTWLLTWGVESFHHMRAIQQQRTPYAAAAADNCVQCGCLSSASACQRPNGHQPGAERLSAIGRGSLG
jgi:hypothetical protein